APLTHAVTQPTKGVSSYVDPNLRFNPNGEYEALDTGESDTVNGDFTYKATDGQADSAAANVAVTVNGANDAPVCLDRSITTNEDTIGAVPASWRDVDGGHATLT